jgi:hypothetical protein
MARLFTDQSVYHFVPNFALNTRVEFAYEAFRFQCKLWEKYAITGPPVITYIYFVDEVMHPVYPPPNGPSVTEHVPNWNVRQA